MTAAQTVASHSMCRRRRFLCDAQRLTSPHEPSSRLMPPLRSVANSFEHRLSHSDLVLGEVPERGDDRVLSANVTLRAPSLYDDAVQPLRFREHLRFGAERRIPLRLRATETERPRARTTKGRHSFAIAFSSRNDRQRRTKTSARAGSLSGRHTPKCARCAHSMARSRNECVNS